MRKLFGRVMPLVFFTLMVCMLGCAVAESEWKEITAGSSPFVYSDELLMVDENRLDPDIAKISAALASAAYNSSTTKSILSQMGFKTIESHYDANYTLNDNDYVAYTIAQKISGDYTIYCVPIRGTAAENGLDWLSNINFVSDGKYHTGFHKAAKRVMDDLMEMINNDGSSNDKRIIWLTGHSRGAAVANIIAGELTSASKGHVFGYTFACPAVYVGTAPAYANIYNFNFLNDVVPSIPPTHWGYTCYGKNASKDIFSWDTSIMTSMEVNSLVSTVFNDSKIGQLALSLISWSLTNRNINALRTALAYFEYDDPEGIIYLLSKGHKLDDDFSTFKAEYLLMTNFWNDNYEEMRALPDEEWSAYRQMEENAEFFRLYDSVAGSTVSSYEQLKSVMATVYERNAAANELISASDALSLLFTSDWELKGILSAHDHKKYVKWMNQDYFGYNACAGNSYENTEIVINARTVAPNCFAGATGNYSVKMEKVVAVGGNAFNNSTGLIKVDIGEAMRYLGGSAFSGCASLSGTVKLPEGMKSLSGYVFYGCSSLEEIIIPNSMETIGARAFQNCSGLKKVTIPLSTTYDVSIAAISSATFEGCGNIEELTFTVGNGTIFDAGYGSNKYALTMRSQTSLKKVTFVEGIGMLPERALYFCANLEEAILPSTLTAISDFAFYECHSLKSIVIPEDVESIGIHAFENCKSLINVEMGSKVKTIGEYAFGFCGMIENMVIPRSVTDIGDLAFFRCEKWKESFPIWETTESIGGSAFSGCVSLSGSVKLPEEMTNLSSSVFSGCSNLEEVIIPNSMEAIGARAFQNCSGLKKVTIPLSTTYDVSTAAISSATFEGCGNIEELTFTVGNGTIFDAGYGSNKYALTMRSQTSLKKATFAEGITILPEKVLYECYKIEEVFLPSTLTAISDYAFRGCASLANITIPENVGDIGEYAFSGCDSLADITIPENVSDIGEYAFNDCDVLKTVKMGTKIERIGVSAFERCKELVSMTVPESVKEIGASAFGDCEKWEGEFPIWETTESIGGSAFRGCASLSGTVKLPEGMKSLSGYVFYGCSSLEEIIIPDSMETIGACAFQNCSGLKKVTIPLSTTYDVSTAAISSATFEGCGNIEELTFTVGNGTIFDAGYGSNKYALTMRSQTSLKKVTFVEGIGMLPERALYFCANLEEAILPSTLTAISDFAFYECHSLKSIVIPEDVESIGIHAFENCKSLINVEMGSKVKTIGEYAFGFCGMIENMVIPRSVTDIGDLAFFRCEKWKESFPIWETTESIGGSAFSGCVSLSGSVKLPEEMTNLSSSVFSGCSNLEEVIIPNSMEAIGACAFQNCSGLKKVTIPLSTTYDVSTAAISSATFEGCGNIEELTFTVGNGTIFDAGYGSNKYALTMRSKYTLKKTIFTEGVTELPERVLYDCNALEEVIFMSRDIELEQRICSENVEVHGYYGSTAQEYAKNYNHPFVPLADCVHNAVVLPSIEVGCETDGLTEGAKCSFCEVILTAQEIIPAKGHDIVTDAAVEPTCTETGLTEGKYCSVCEEVFAYQTIVPATGHKAVTSDNIPPTCTNPGWTAESKCEVCGESIEEKEEIPALGHTPEVLEGKDATCTTDGLTEGAKCSVCGEILTAQEVIPAKGHETVVNAAVEPTCTETGLTEGKYCSVCNEVLEPQTVVSAAGHKLTEGNGVPPTCTTPGWTAESKCEICGETIEAKDEIPVLGHKTEIIEGKDATCTVDGLTDGEKCSVCGEILTAQEITPALGHHEVVLSAIPATHITPGLSEGISCSRCGEILVSQVEIPAVDVIKTYLPIGMTFVGKYAFANTAVECVIISENCKRVEAYAFAGNEALKFVEIPASVEYIDSTAFADCAVDLIIVTASESHAHMFALEKGIAFVLIGE